MNGEGGKRPFASLANSLWVDRELEIKDSYAGLLEENYYAPAYQVSFDEKETWEQMGRWISDHTEGVMEPELPMDSRTLLALINTLYYYGAWAEEFPASETEEEEFHREDGSTSRGEFMHVSVSDSAYREGDGWKTASLGIRDPGVWTRWSSCCRTRGPVWRNCWRPPRGWRRLWIWAQAAGR